MYIVENNDRNKLKFVIKILKEYFWFLSFEISDNLYFTEHSDSETSQVKDIIYFKQKDKINLC